MNNGGKYLMVLLALSGGCDRQIPILENSSIIGYEVQGTVTDQIGNPVPNVDVFLDYTANLVGADIAPTRRYFVPDPSIPVRTVVVNWSKQVIRVLTPLQYYFGWYQVFWDGKDSTGSVPPSGIYYIEYVVGGSVKFSYNQLVSGGQVATTDTKGQYTIPIQYLPVDSASVPYFSAYDSSYVGNLLISNDVILTFQYPTHIQQVERALNKGQVTIINIVFH
jgi:hypothetical protein